MKAAPPLVALFAALASFSCNGGVITPDGGSADARPADTRPDTGPSECTSDRECDNGVFCDGAERCMDNRCVAPVTAEPCDDRRSCTADSCDEEGRRCVHEADHSMCGDGNACNGIEQCDPSQGGASTTTGCTPVRPMNVLDCNDSNNCTLDSCDRTVGCVHAPRDLDGDGHVDRSCSVDGTDRGVQGTDCNDGDPDVYPGSTEDCADGRDNNCDGRVDLQDTAVCRATNDTCATATPLPAPGMYWGSTVSQRSDVELGCNPGTIADSFFTFTLTEPKDVTLSISSVGSTAGLALLRSCDPLDEVRCNRGTASAAPRIRARSLPAGTYFVAAETGTPGAAFRLTYAVAPPTPVPGEDLCPSTVELNDGMPHVAHFADYEDDYTLSCNVGGGRRDAVFKLTLANPSDVYLRASTGTTSFSTTYLSFRAAPCNNTAMMNEFRCSTGTNTTPILQTRRSMPAGTYFVVVENSSDQDVTVTAEVVTPPAPRLAEDLCPMAGGATVDLRDQMPHVARFAMLEDDYMLSCGTSARRDAVFSLTLDAPADVIVRASPVSLAATGTTYLSFRAEPCDTNTGERRCLSGIPTAPPTVSQRGLPAGRYWIHVENSADQDVNVQAMITSPPAPRAPEDVCPVVAPPPADGGASDASMDASADVRPPPPDVVPDVPAPVEAGMDAAVDSSADAASTGDGAAPLPTQDPPDLGDGMPRVARLMVLEDDHVLTCNPGAMRKDAVFKLTITTTSDLALRANAASGQTYLQLRDATSCASTAGDRRCTAASMTSIITQRGLPPGTYWVLVENSLDADTTVQAMLTPSAPVPRYTRIENPAGVSFVDVCSLPDTVHILRSLDDRTEPLPATLVPFPIRVFGLPVLPPYAVCSNGWISFTNTTTASTFGTIGDSTEPNMLVAAMWGDLTTRAEGVCMNTVGAAPNRAIVVQWQDVGSYGDSDSNADFEIIIREATPGQSNVIDVVYRRILSFERTTVGGIENEDGSLSTTIPMPVMAPRTYRLAPTL